MGAFCCRPCLDDSDDYSHPNNSIYRQCVCLRFLFHQLYTGYAGIFHRLEGRSISSPTQGGYSLASSGIGAATSESYFNDSHISVSRPLSYDPEQRYSRLQRDGLVSRRDKSVAQFQDDSQTPRRNISGSGIDSLGFEKKGNGVDFDDDCKLGLPDKPEKPLETKFAHGLAYAQPSSEDEDVCPTCLEEYTPENPRITTQCSHHYHLSCIYEWMERSESCPICGKEMEFCETP